MNFRDPHRADRTDVPIAPVEPPQGPDGEPVELLRRAIIVTRFRRSAATAALLAELAFSILNDRRYS